MHEWGPVYLGSYRKQHLQLTLGVQHSTETVYFGHISVFIVWIAGYNTNGKRRVDGKVLLDTAQLKREATGCNTIVKYSQIDRESHRFAVGKNLSMLIQVGQMAIFPYSS